MKKTDNPANKWHKQRENDRTVGQEIENRREGECINNLFD